MKDNKIPFRCEYCCARVCVCAWAASPVFAVELCISFSRLPNYERVIHIFNSLVFPSLSPGQYCLFFVGFIVVVVVESTRPECIAKAVHIFCAEIVIIDLYPVL